MRWLRFLIVPVLLLCVLDVAAVVLLGAVLEATRGGFWDLLVSFLEYFVVGASILALAPRPGRALAMTYALLLAAALVFLTVMVEGSELHLLGATTIHQASWLKEGVRFAGLFLAVWFGSAELPRDAREVRDLSAG